MKRISLLSILLTTLLLSACSAEEETPPAAAEDPEGGAPDSSWFEAWRAQGPAMMFMRSRVGDLIDRRLPEAVESKKLTQARKLCDLGEEMIGRMDARWGEAPMDAGSTALFARFQERCAVEVAGAVLDDLIASLEGASEEDLSTMCSAGNRDFGFSAEHPTEDPGIAEKRERIFAKCPDLKQNWEMFQRGKPTE